MKKERHELSIEIKGRTYTGYRIVEWTKTGDMYQLIYYRDHLSYKDIRKYKPGHEKTMESVAKLILEQLVSAAGEFK